MWLTFQARRRPCGGAAGPTKSSTVEDHVAFFHKYFGFTNNPVCESAVLTIVLSMQRDRAD
jgi:hypothetical protein